MAGGSDDQGAAEDGVPEGTGGGGPGAGGGPAGRGPDGKKFVLDPGLATVIAAVIALLGVLAGLWFNRENPTLVRNLEGQVATLTAERDTAQTEAGTSGADLAACLAAADGVKETADGLDGQLTVCTSKREKAESDVELWRGRYSDTNEELIRVRGEMERARGERDDLVRQMTALREARHLAIMNTYDGVIGTLMRLRDNSSEYSNDSSASAQRAFRNDVQDRLNPVEEYRYEFGEVQKFFNEEITELLEDLESGRLTEPEALQRRIEEALTAFGERREQLGKELQIMDDLQAKIIGE